MLPMLSISIVNYIHHILSRNSDSAYLDDFYDNLDDKAMKTKKKE
jgi:hypothetical protein